MDRLKLPKPNLIFQFFFWVKFDFGLNFKKLKFIDSVLILTKIISNQTETDRYISL